MSHLRANGFRVKPQDVSDTSPYHTRFGVPAALTSCHTAVIGSYFLEGHVPIREIKRLLAEQPKARGLAVPGMPPNSLGMDDTAQGTPYDVMLVLADGSYRSYAHYDR